MPTTKLTHDIIQAAIDGYEAQKARIDASIAELRAMLSGAPAPKSTGTSETVSAKPKKKRRLSAAGRKAIAEAARKRWAAFNAAKKAK